MKNLTKVLLAGAFIVAAVMAAPNVTITIGEPLAAACSDNDDLCED